VENGVLHAPPPRELFSMLKPEYREALGFR
jgi:hypothetical protein